MPSKTSGASVKKSLAPPIPVLINGPTPPSKRSAQPQCSVHCESQTTEVPSTAPTPRLTTLLWRASKSEGMSGGNGASQSAGKDGTSLVAGKEWDKSGRWEGMGSCIAVIVESGLRSDNLRI